MVVKYIFKKVVLNEHYIENQIFCAAAIVNYFYICPSRSAKNYRLKAIKRYHELRELKLHLASDNSILGKV
jgi:hypothetical protein